MKAGAGPIRVLVVDDEPLARKGIRMRLADEPDVEVVGEAEDGPDAVRKIARLRPDLVFLDVQMPGKDGFEVLADVADVHLPAVIFVTAFDRYALRAFDVHALDYLLKPATDERFRETLSRVRRHVLGGDALQRGVAKLLDSIRGESSRYPSRLPVRDGERYVLVKTADIVVLRADRNYVLLETPRGSHQLRGTLAAIAKKLDPDVFVRIHRSSVVNTRHIREIRSTTGGDYEVLLDTGQRLRMSRVHRSALLA